jgi:hypothetical protein
MRDEVIPEGQPEALAEGTAEALSEGLWLTIPDAARRLRVTPQAIRDRVRRGTLDTRREAHGNRVKLLVKVDPAMAPSPDEGLEQRLMETLDQRLAEALPKALEKVLAEHVGDLRVRAERAEAELDTLRARRRWPGVKIWWQRFWDGEG